MPQNRSRAAIFSSRFSTVPYWGRWPVRGRAAGRVFVLLRRRSRSAKVILNGCFGGISGLVGGRSWVGCWVGGRFCGAASVYLREGAQPIDVVPGKRGRWHRLSGDCGRGVADTRALAGDPFCGLAGRSTVWGIPDILEGRAGLDAEGRRSARTAVSTSRGPRIRARSSWVQPLRMA